MLVPKKLKPRKQLSFDALIKDVHCAAEKLPDHRTGKCDYLITDAVMSAIAMFSLKDASLLKFQERRNDQNLKDIYRIGKIPSNTCKQDGETKNDCERNASKRLLTKFHEEHPHLKVIVVEDGLSSNAPHIRLLKKLRMPFLLVAKPTDHKFLFQAVEKAREEDRLTTIQWQEDGSDVTCEISFGTEFALNKSNPDVRVNFLQYCEYNAEAKRIKYHTWVTDLTITKSNARQLVRGVRARWKIENETFNTVKNQGYQFEHNFGHGRQNLSVVFAMLMMLTFLIDQTQERCCPVFQAVRKEFTSRTSVWDWVRSHFRHFRFTSMQHLYEAIINDSCRNIPFPTMSFYGSRVT